MTEKVYIPGQIHKIKVGMGQIGLSDTVTTKPDGTETRKANTPVTVYDTSGPYSDAAQRPLIRQGIERIREEWNGGRKDIIVCKPSADRPSERAAFPVTHPVRKARNGRQITQMSYARKRIITPEMEYVAIRENQQVEAMGLKSYITPDFVRKEVAAGRAVIPCNINHPEVEPMIIGRRFLVKVNTYIYPCDVPAEEVVREMTACCRWGADMLMDMSTQKECHAAREWLLRNCPTPVGASPLYQALVKADGNPEHLSWSLFRETLIEQAQQGVDVMTIHAAMQRKHLPLINSRLVDMVSRSGIILSEWMRTHRQENFLYTHFGEICEILKAYDISLFLCCGLRPDAIYDASDYAHVSELRGMKQLIEQARTQYVQTMAEGPGHIPLHKIEATTREHTYICKGVPFFTTGMAITDIAGMYEYVASAIGSAQIAWHGASLICANTVLPGREDRQASIIAHKIAAHAADIAKGHPGAQVRDNALGKALGEARQDDIRRLTID